jgi:hypothetical protein
MTRNELKSLLLIPAADTSKDDFFDVALPLLIEFVQAHCNDSFTDENGVLCLPGGVKLAIAQLAKHYMKDWGVSSQDASDLSLSFFSNDIPEGIKQMLKPYRKARFL